MEEKSTSMYPAEWWWAERQVIQNVISQIFRILYFSDFSNFKFPRFFNPYISQIFQIYYFFIQFFFIDKASSVENFINHNIINEDDIKRF